MINKILVEEYEEFENNLSDRFVGNGSFRSYSRSDPGSFRSYSLLVRSFRPGSFRPDFRGGLFRLNFGGSFRPTLFYIVFRS